jgi:hypothetical protein
MGFNFLSYLIIKLILVSLGLFLVVRGKQLKEKQAQPSEILSPGTIIIIGYVIAILNIIQILWLFYDA